tara:strand:+ start:1626 stop:2420 length:795 start_codon:yes stop_codon:yes gene_type:complete
MTTENNAAPGAAAELPAPVETAIDTTGIATPAEVETTAAPEPVNEAERALKRMERRIGNVTRARYEAEARAQQAEERAQRIEAMLQERQPTQQDGTRTDTQGIRPEDIERLVNHRAREIREMESVVYRSQQIKTDLITKVGEDRFGTVIESVIEEAGQIALPNGLWTPLGEAIADSEKPAELLAYLAENPDEAGSLKGLTPAQLGRRIARIEAEIAKPKDAPKPSSAPKPLEPVKGATETSKDPSSMSDAEFAAWRRRQIAQRR